MNLSEITKDLIIPLILGGFDPSNLYSSIQGYNNNLKSKNIEDCVQILQEKVKKSILDGKLPELNHKDNNLMISMFEEMQETYTEVKRDCITNLVVNMLHEKKNGTFQLYLYQVLLDQLKQMFDPEISLLKVIYANKDSLWAIENNKTLLSIKKISEFVEYSEYRIKKLENLAFLKLNTGFSAGVDSMGEYRYNSEYFNVFYNKACTVLYEVEK